MAKCLYAARVGSFSHSCWTEAHGMGFPRGTMAEMDEKLMRILLVVGAVVVAVVLALWVLKVIWWLTIGVAVVLLIGFLLREKA